MGKKVAGDMSENDELEEEGTEEPETSEANSVSTPKKTTDWQVAYKGLQVTLQKAKNQLQVATESRDTLAGELEEAKSTIREQETKIANLEGQLGDKGEEVTKTLSEAAKDKKDLERARYIMKNYPQLVSFEVVGGLPAAETEEELGTKLKGFVESLERLVGKKVANEIAGTLPGISVSTADELEEPPDLTDEEDKLYHELSMNARNPIKAAEIRSQLDEIYKKKADLKTKEK
jgi:hypothetical protein